MPSCEWTNGLRTTSSYPSWKNICGSLTMARVNPREQDSSGQSWKNYRRATLHWTAQTWKSGGTSFCETWRNHNETHTDLCVTLLLVSLFTLPSLMSCQVGMVSEITILASRTTNSVMHWKISSMDFAAIVRLLSNPMTARLSTSFRGI